MTRGGGEGGSVVATPPTPLPPRRRRRRIAPAIRRPTSLLSPFFLLLVVDAKFRGHHEALRSFPPPHDLPHPLSDSASCESIAPDDEGDIHEALYLIGGCVGPYMPTMTTGGRDLRDRPGGGGGATTGPRGGGDDEGGEPAAPSSEEEESRPPFPPSSSASKEYLCSRVTSEILSYVPQDGWFAKRRSMPRERHRHTATTVNGQIWVVGGRDGNDEVVRQVDLYDPGLDAWTTPLTLPRNLTVSDHAAFTKNGILYVAGGYDQYYNSVPTLFSIDTSAALNGYFGLVVGSPMGTPRGDVHAATFGSYGYVAGGYDSDGDGKFCEPLSSVEAYDTRTDEWIYVNDMVVPRSNVILMKYDKKFYALGGERPDPSLCVDVDDDSEGEGDGQGTTTTASPRSLSYPVDSVEVYDPATGLSGGWSIIEGHLPGMELDGDDVMEEGEGRYRFSIASWSEMGLIFAFGGVYGPNHRQIAGTTEATIFGEEVHGGDGVPDGVDYDDREWRCDDCLKPSGGMIVYEDILVDESLGEMAWRIGPILLIAGGCLAGAVMLFGGGAAYAVKKKKKKRRKKKSALELQEEAAERGRLAAEQEGGGYEDRRGEDDGNRYGDSATVGVMS